MFFDTTHAFVECRVHGRYRWSGRSWGAGLITRGSSDPSEASRRSSSGGFGLCGGLAIEVGRRGVQVNAALLGWIAPGSQHPEELIDGENVPLGRTGSVKRSSRRLPSSPPGRRATSPGQRSSSTAATPFRSSRGRPKPRTEAERRTIAVSTMWCAYLFAILALIVLRQAIGGVRSARTRESAEVQPRGSSSRSWVAPPPGATLPGGRPRRSRRPLPPSGWRSPGRSRAASRWRRRLYPSRSGGRGMRTILLATRSPVPRRSPSRGWPQRVRRRARPRSAPPRTCHRISASCRR